MRMRAYGTRCAYVWLTRIYESEGSDSLLIYE